MTDTALRVTGVRKAFGGTQALAGASLEVRKGSIHAIVGGNGSGKSTLIKILAGVVSADAGDIEVGGAVHDARAQTPANARACGLHFVHQQNSTFPDLSVAENLALGREYETAAGWRVRWSALNRRAEEVLRRFEIDAAPSTLVGQLGPATQMMVAIARALQDQEDAHGGVLVLDEPTASLPRHEVALLLDAMRRYAAAGQTIIYVSHRLDEVLDVADEVTVLRDGHVIGTRARDGLDEQTLITLIMGEAIESTEFRSTRAPGDVVLEVPGLSVRSGEVVGLAGLLGSGRTEVLRGLFGAGAASAAMRIDGQEVTCRDAREAMDAGIAYIPEDRAADAAFAELSVKENLSLTALDRYWRGGRIRRRSERAAAEELTGAFRVRAASVEAPLSSLSGGNQQKVILARWMQRKPRVLLLDEPTQGVDVGARAEIHAMVRDIVDEGAAALLVSSDFAEIAAVCDRAIVLRDGRIVAEVNGADLREETLNAAVYAEEIHA